MNVGFVKWDRGLAFWKLTDVLWKSARTSYPFRRLCFLMHEMGAQTLAIEHPLDSSWKEYERLSKEVAAIRKRIGKSVGVEAYKLTFVGAGVDDAKQLLGLPEEAFLGYAIVLNIEGPSSRKLSFIFESVIRESGSRLIGTPYGGGKGIRPVDYSNIYLHVKRRFPCYVIGRLYNIIGTYFCQQNTITSVCAHACAAMIINNCRQDRNENSKPRDIITCEDINQNLGIDHEHRALEAKAGWADNELSTHNGLDLKEVAKVLRVHGLCSYRQTFGETPRKFREFLYGFIESGFPALLTFRVSTERGQGDGFHVVAVVGHSLNPGSWFPLGYALYVRKDPGNSDRSYLSTIDWVDDFVVHDDGLGMQLCLPVHSFRPEGRPDPGLKFAPIEALGVFPVGFGVKTIAHEAEQIAWACIRHFFKLLYDQTLLNASHYYLRHLLGPILSTTTQTAVVRTQLVSREDYLEHILREDSKGDILAPEHHALVSNSIAAHDFFWLIEISEPDLYIGDNGKLIDVLIDSSLEWTEQSLEAEKPNHGVLLMKLPGLLGLPIPDSTSCSVTKTNVSGYCPLFTLK